MVLARQILVAILSEFAHSFQVFGKFWGNETRVKYAFTRSKLAQLIAVN
jgi:hypothetical protein